MKTVNKQTSIYAILLSLVIAFTMLFASIAPANAVSGPATSKTSPGVIYVGYTRVGDGEVIYRGDSGKASVTYDGFKYTKSNNTLTLNKLGTDEDYYLQVQDMGDDFKIKVVGKNSLGYIGLYSSAKDRMNLKITGTGTLTVNTDGAYGAAIHGYAKGKSNTKITVTNTVNLNLYGGENIFTGKKEKVIIVEDAKSSDKKNVFSIGGTKYGDTTVKRTKTKKGYKYTYGAYKLIIKAGENKTVKTSIAKATTSISDLTYNGKERKPSFTVKLKGTKLIKGTDYKITKWEKNKNAGTAYVTIQGIGGYKGTCKFSFNIKKKKMSLTVSPTKITKDSDQIGKTVTIKATTDTNGKVTYASSDKTVAAVSSKGVVTIKGKGTATISVKAADKNGSSNYSATTKKVTVKVTQAKKTRDIKFDYTYDNVHNWYIVPYSNGEAVLPYETSDEAEYSYDYSANDVIGTEYGSNNFEIKKNGTVTFTVKTEATSVYKAASKQIKFCFVETDYYDNFDDLYYDDGEYSELAYVLDDGIPIPSLGSTSRVPQGLCMTDDYYLVSVYNAFEKNKLCADSEILVLNRWGDLLTALDIKGDDGSTMCWDLYSHVGGLAYDSDRKVIYIADSDSDEYHNSSGADDKLNNIIWELPVSTINAAVNSGKEKYPVVPQVAFNTSIASSCVTYYDGVVYVGQFNKDSEEKNLIQGYKYDNGSFSAYGPQLTLPLKTQGFGFLDNNGEKYIVCSTSYGRKNRSHLYIRKATFTGDKLTSITSAGQKIVNMPNMSEDVFIDQSGELYTVFESASYLYSYEYFDGMKPIDMIMSVYIRGWFADDDE